MQLLKYPLIKPNLPKPEEFSKYLEKSYATHTFTNFGPAVIELQERVKQILKLPTAPLTFCNATAALEVILESLDASGKEVLVPSYTFAASSLSAERVQALPVLVDNDLDTWHMDLNDAEKRLTTKTKFLMLIHPLGLVKDLKSYIDFCNKHELTLIVDAAAAFGAEYSNTNWSDAIHIFSGHATKTLGMAEAGIATSDNPKLVEKWRKLSNFGLNERAETELLGTNAKLSEFHAAIGLASLDRLPNILSKRRQLAAIYDERLKKCLKQTSNHKQHTYPMYPFRYLGDVNKLKERLESNGIGYRQYYRPLHWHPRYKNNRDLPNADLLGKTIFCIPCYETLKPEDVEFICDIINE